VDLDLLFDRPIFGGRALGPRGRARAGRCRTVAEYTRTPGWTATLAGADLPPASSPDQIGDLWLRHPGAEVRLRTGTGFDVLDVPGQAGFQALVRLERMGVRPGPVLAAGDRALFLVTPHTAEVLPELLYRTGWDDAALDLRCHGVGGSVPAPPTELTRWLRPPTPESAARPPEARLLLGTLAYACHQGVAGLVGRR